MGRRKQITRSRRAAAPTAAARDAASVGARRLWPAALLVAAALVAYGNALSLPFVMDDRGTIVDNANIRQLWPFTTALTGPAQSAVAGRPVVSLSLAINYALGGLSPWGYHVWNLGVHVLAALVLFGIVRRTLLWGGHVGPPLHEENRRADLTKHVGADPRACPERSSFDKLRTSGRMVGPEAVAWICALVWLIHPLQTEVVDYVTERSESMMGLFYLLTLYAAIRAMDADRDRARWWSAISVIGCALGMATKESMVTAPLMVLLYDALFRSGGVRRALRARPRFYAALAATGTILIALVASGPRSHSAGLSSGVTPWTYFLNQPAMIVRYLELTFWPRSLVLDYGVTHAIPFREAWPFLAVVALLAALVVVLWRTHPAIGFLGAWFFVTLAPSSSIVPIATEVGAERRMYLPLAAIVVLAVLAGRLVIGTRRRIVAPVVAAVSCALIALTIARNAEYRSEAGIWQTVLDRRPHGRAHYNLGVVLAEEGRRDEAIAHYQQAVADTPEAHYALGFELDAGGRTADAIHHLREYVRLLPDDVNSIRAYTLLGRALAASGRPEEAVAAFREALRRQPRNADARGGLADALLGLERFDEAEREYREYLRAMPANAVAHYNLGLALVGTGRLEAAIDQFREAVRIEPGFADARQNLEAALADLNRKQ